MRKLFVMGVAVIFATSAFAQNLEPVRARFQQTVELSAECMLGNLGVGYIAGYRFNPSLFLGVGAGVNYSFGSNDNAQLMTTDETLLPMHKLNVPIYLNLKAYFLKNTRCTPFLSLAAGGRLSTDGTANLVMGEARYNTCGIIANAAIGAEYRLSQSKSIHISVGAGTQSIPYAKNITSYGFDNVSKYKPTVDLRVGFTF